MNWNSERNGTHLNRYRGHLFPVPRSSIYTRIIITPCSLTVSVLLNNDDTTMALLLWHRTYIHSSDSSYIHTYVPNNHRQRQFNHKSYNITFNITLSPTHSYVFWLPSFSKFFNAWNRLFLHGSRTMTNLFS